MLVKLAMFWTSCGHWCAVQSPGLQLERCLTTIHPLKTSQPPSYFFNDKIRGENAARLRWDWGICIRSNSRLPVC
jgi:hypothetical protein